MALQLKHAFFSFNSTPVMGAVSLPRACGDVWVQPPSSGPHPAALSLQVILDLKGSDYSWSYQTPPSSPSTTMSRKSSVCR